MKSQPAHKIDNENLLSLQTHHPFSPQEVRVNDPVKATISFGGVEHKLNVWKISPFGIELESNKDIHIDPTHSYSVTVNIGQESSTLKGLLVHTYQQNNRDILCIRFTSDPTPYNDKDRRTKNRWNCSGQFYPTGIANSPAKYNDFIYFKIKDISYGGMKITCSLRNKFLFPKMTLNSMINFPMLSQVNLKLKIINLNIDNEDGKDIISIGASFDTSDPKINSVICNYLLQFSNASSFKELQEQGFNSTNVSSAVDFSYVKTEKDYQDSLKLRLDANKLANKVENDLTIDDMADEYDARSRIVIGRHNSEVVSTVRMAFHEIDDKMEIEKYTVLPESFPRRDESIEIMRLCTHQDYRGSDLLMALFKHLAIVVVQSRRKYIVTSCVEKLIPLYKKIGFKEAQICYVNPLFPEHPDHVMVANIETLLLGNGINPIIWNLVWGDLYNYFESYDMVEYTPLDKLRVKTLRAFKPIAQILNRKKLRKK